MYASSRKAFTLIELLVVIAIIAILAVVVVLTLNPAELLRQSRDSNRLFDLATIINAINIYNTDQGGSQSYSLGSASTTYISLPDPTATSTAGDQCQGLGMPSLNASSGQAWQCSSSSTYRNVNNTGWIPATFSNISAGSPIGSLPVDPINQTSSGLFYAYNTNRFQFEVTADLESQKYKTQYGQTPQTSLFPEVISGGTPTVSALYNPSGLVGYWPMDEGSGSSTIDQSGNGNPGTWSGTPIGSGGTYYTGGKIGVYAGEFNGSNDYVAISAGSALEALSSTGTVSAWINYSIATTSLRFVLDLGGTGSHGLDLQAGGGLNDPAFQYGNGSASVTMYAPSILSIGPWYLVTATWSSSGAAIYINGLLNISTSTAPSITPYATTMYIGANGGTQRYMGGGIDDIRVYNRVLSPAEIMALYNAEH